MYVSTCADVRVKIKIDGGDEAKEFGFVEKAGKPVAGRIRRE